MDNRTIREKQNSNIAAPEMFKEEGYLERFNKHFLNTLGLHIKLNENRDTVIVENPLPVDKTISLIDYLENEKEVE